MGEMTITVSKWSCNGVRRDMYGLRIPHSKLITLFTSMLAIVSLKSYLLFPLSVRLPHHTEQPSRFVSEPARHGCDL